MISKYKSTPLEGTIQDPASDIELINKYSIKALTPEDVFTFSAILCDNEIDRDCERFSDDCIVELAELFIGKTGIFNHLWDAQNQIARIYKTEVEREGGKVRLRAYAYILRGDSTEEIISKIEGGILKEVSVGVSVEKTTCSICGENLGSSDCGHRRGREYDGDTCHGILEGAADAYEFSFVAVPAQREAGVTKIAKSYEAIEKTLENIMHKLDAIENVCADLTKSLERKPPNPEVPETASDTDKPSSGAVNRMAAFFNAYAGKS